MRFAFKILVAVAVAEMAICLPARADLVDAIEALVGESVITFQQVNAFVMADDDILWTRAKHVQKDYRRLQLELFMSVLRAQENDKLILHEFASAGFKIPENIIDGYVQDRINEMFHDDRMAMMRQLEHQGQTEEEFRQRLHDEFIIGVMRQKFVPDPIISPLKVESYYQEHKDEFKVADEAKMRLIVLNKSADDSTGSVRKRMEEIVSQIKDGAAFADMAKSYSEGSQRIDGGETGWQEVSTLNPVIVETISKLKPGEMSGVVDSKDAYFLILLEERRPARIRPLSEIRADIEKTLLVRERARLLDRWINRLKRKTFIQSFGG